MQGADAVNRGAAARIGIAVMLVPGVAPAAAATCSVSPQGVSFGSYDTLSPAPLDGVGNIGVSCDTVTAFTISLSAGGGSYSERLMTAGAAALPYNLYTDASRLTVWGDGSGGTGIVSMSATAHDFAVHGRIPARQNVVATTYVDTIFVTISY